MSHTFVVGAIEQIATNTQDRAMLGDYPDAVLDAVIGSMETHTDLATQVLSNEQVRRGFARVLLELLAA